MITTSDWIVFPTLGNAPLFAQVKNRLIELGFNFSDGGGHIGHSISVNKSGMVSHTSDSMRLIDGRGICGHVLGDLNKLFFTDEYSLKPTSIKVKLNDSYTAEVKKDVVVVGCQRFPISIIDELVKARNDVSSLS